MTKLSRSGSFRFTAPWIFAMTGLAVHVEAVVLVGSVDQPLLAVGGDVCEAAAVVALGDVVDDVERLIDLAKAAFERLVVVRRDGDETRPTRRDGGASPAAWRAFGGARSAGSRRRTGPGAVRRARRTRS